MNNNYKILINDNDKLKKKKFGINNIAYNNNINTNINYFLLKLIIVLIFFVTILNKINQLRSIFELEEEEIESEEENQTIPGVHQRRRDFWNISYLKNVLHRYSLYKIFRIPQISLILIDKSKNKKGLYNVLNHIKNITSQKLTNFEIILYRQNIKRTEYQIINNQLKQLIKSKKIKIVIKTDKIHNIYSYIINSINGLYTIFVDNINLIKYLSLDEIYNSTNGQISNYYNISLSNDSNIYLLRSKFLKDFTDKGREFDSINEIIDAYNSITIPQFNYIHIALCPDNLFTKLAYVAMTSILTSKNINSFICFHLVISSDFEQKNKEFLNSLHEQYLYFNISFIEMDDRYQKAYTDRRITTQAYYRFSLGELLPNLDKIIYLDTDILVYKDLTNFYNLNFEGKMILGQATYGNFNKKKNGPHSINSGVLFLNLFEMRKNNLESRVIKIIKKRKKFTYHDQTIINDYFRKYVGLLPPEYHTRPWSNFREMKIFLYKTATPLDKDYFYFANKYPTIRHYLGGYKPRNPKVNFIEDWWFFARKSKYYNPSAKTFETAFFF